MDRYSFAAGDSHPYPLPIFLTFTIIYIMRSSTVEAKLKCPVLDYVPRSRFKQSNFLTDMQHFSVEGN